MVGTARLFVVFVVDGDVIENVLAVLRSLFGIHPLHAVFYNGRELVGKGRVVGLTGRHSAGEDVAVSVLMLEAFARESGAPGGGPEQKASGPRVGRRPDGVAHPLEAEHGIKRIHRQHRHAEVGVAGAGGYPFGHAARFGDAFFKQLPVFAFGVREQKVVIHRLVELAHRRIDAELSEQRVHPESASLVSHYRHDPCAAVGVAQQGAQHGGENHRG